MLGRNRKYIPHSERMKFAEQRILPVAVHLVDGEKQGLAGAGEQARQLAIGACDLGARINNHDNGRRFFERNFGLAEDLRRDEILVFGNNAARIHHSKLVSEPFDFAIEAVSRDARLVSDDGAPRSSQVVEQRRFADVGASDDGDEW
jgi:hypothetical protein